VLCDFVSTTLHSLTEHDDVVWRLCEQGARRYGNTHVDRQVGHRIIAFEPNAMIGQKFLGPETSTENICTCFNI